MVMTYGVQGVGGCLDMGVGTLQVGLPQTRISHDRKSVFLEESQVEAPVGGRTG